MKAENHQEWAKSCQQKRAQGVNLIRTHIVEKPYSPYIEWELKHYEYINMPKCGEKIYLINKVDAAGLSVPDGDLMIFDNARAVVNSYDQNGLMVDETFYDESDDISGFLDLAVQLKKLARPLTIKP